MQKKIWGKTDQVFINNYSEVQYMEIKKGGYCSQHMHRFKHNNFYVISGKLKIIITTGEKDEEHILEAGESFHISPNIYHKFLALEETQAIEAYWLPPTMIDTYDIHRVSVGGFENNS